MRVKIKAAVLIAVTTLFIISCSNEKGTASIDMDAVKKEIQAMEDAYAAAEKAKDADKVIAYYSDDAIGYGRNRPPEVGKTAIK